MLCSVPDSKHCVKSLACLICHFPKDECDEKRIRYCQNVWTIKQCCNARNLIALIALYIRRFFHSEEGPFGNVEFMYEIVRYESYSNIHIVLEYENKSTYDFYSHAVILGCHIARCFLRKRQFGFRHNVCKHGTPVVSKCIGMSKRGPMFRRLQNRH